MSEDDAAERLCASGPLVSVAFSRAPTSPGKPGLGAEPIAGTMLIDTGADATVIAEDVARALGLVRIGEAEVLGVTDATAARFPVYRLRIALPVRRRGELADHVVPIDAIALPRGDGSADGLVGRDVLRRLRFNYDGPSGAFSLEIT